MGKNVNTEIKCHSLLPLDDIVAMVSHPDCIPEVSFAMSVSTYSPSAAVEDYYSRLNILTGEGSIHKLPQPLLHRHRGRNERNLYVQPYVVVV